MELIRRWFRTYGTGIFLALLMLALFTSSVPAVYAQEPVAGAASTTNAFGEMLTTLPSDVQTALTNLFTGLNMLLKAAYSLLIPILGLIGKFLSNDWVTGSVFNLDIVIETLWQLVRNVVNIVIMLYLVYIAGRNILPFGDTGKAEIKKALPFAVIALVLVNFSLFATRFVLNISNLATTVAFSIPNEVAGGVFQLNMGDKTGNKYHMFVWAQPVATDIVNATACPSYYSRRLKSELQMDQHTPAPNLTGDYVCVISPNAKGVTSPSGSVRQYAVNQTEFSREMGELFRATSDKFPGYGQYTVIGISKDTLAGNIQKFWQVECLHKNYSYNFESQFVARYGSSIIANPVFDQSDRNYVPGPGHYKRFLIDQSIVEANAGPNSKYRERLQKIGEYIEATKRDYTTASTNIGSTVTVGTTTNTDHFPYYSDCIPSLDELAFSSRNAMFVYAFNLLKIANFEGANMDFTDLSNVTIRYFLAWIYLSMFILVNVALLIAVVGRAFYIWIMMILSPLWVLTELMGLKAKFLDEGGAGQFVGSFLQFVKLAFMPAVVGLVLSLGFIMFHFLDMIATMEGINLGRMQVGSLSLYFNPNGVVITGLGNVFQLMFAFLAIAAVYFAVFEAIKFGFGKSAITNWVSKVRDFGTSIAKDIAQKPLDAKILPIPGTGQKISLRAAGDLPDALRVSMMADRNKNRADLQQMIDSRFGGGRDSIKQMVEPLKTNNGGADVAKVQNFLDSLKSNPTPDAKKFYHDVIRKMVDKNGNVRQNMSSVSSKIGGESLEISGNAFKALQQNVMQPNNRSAVLAVVGMSNHNELDLPIHQNTLGTLQNTIFTMSGAAAVNQTTGQTPQTPPQGQGQNQQQQRPQTPPASNPAGRFAWTGVAAGKQISIGGKTYLVPTSLLNANKSTANANWASLKSLLDTQSSRGDKEALLRSLQNAKWTNDDIAHILNVVK